MQAIKKRLLALNDRREAFELQKVFESLFNTQCLTAATLTIGAATTLSLGNAITAIIGGQLVSKASGSTIAMTGPTIANTGSVNQAWIITMDAAGTLVALPGVPAATLAGIQLPVVTEVNVTSGLPQVVIGVLTMTNTSVGSFIPGTTLLNVASLGTVVNNTVGPFFPIQIL